MLTRDPAAPPPVLFPLPPSSYPHSTDLAETREASVLADLGGRMQRVDLHLPALPVSVDGCLGLSLSHMPPPPSAASRQVLPPALPLRSPGLRPSRLGCRGQGWGLLLALTGPSWGQERNGQRAPSVPALPHPHPKQFLPREVDSCQEFPRAPVLHPAHSPFSYCCPSPGCLVGSGEVGLVRRARGGRERKARQKEIRMGKRNRWGKTEKGVQKWGPSAPACLGSRCQ